MRWTGPPPLLIAVTVLGFVVAPMVSSAEDGRPADREAASQVQLSSGDGRTDSPPTVPERPRQARPIAPEKKKPVKEERDVVGVVTMNQFRKLSLADAREDALAVTSRPGVDIIGWQEAYHARPVAASLDRRGWATKQFARGARELAVSWRRSEFRLASSAQRLVAYGVDQSTGRYPYSDRYVVRVTLEHRKTGRLLSVINTHLPQKIENLKRPGRWLRTNNAARARFQLERLGRVWDGAPGRWVVGTGDYNFDAGSDARARPHGGVVRTYADRAISSYAALGQSGVQPTHPFSGRYIDYVHASRESVKTGNTRFLDQRTLPGLNSDHRPLLVWFALT